MDLGITVNQGVRIWEFAQQLSQLHENQNAPGEYIRGVSIIKVDIGPITNNLASTINLSPTTKSFNSGDGLAQ
jgi:hypothetical protein